MAKGKTSTANKANEREKVAEKKVSHQKSLTKANKWDFKHLTDEQKKLSIYGIIVILIVIVIIIAIFSF